MSFPVHIDYEDSYVLGIEETPGRIVFVLEAALLPGHPQWRAPRPNEALCYKDARLVFEPARSVTWGARAEVANHDPGGEDDMGSLDETEAHGESYRLAGEWGEVRIVGGPPRLEILGDSAL